MWLCYKNFKMRFRTGRKVLYTNSALKQREYGLVQLTLKSNRINQKKERKGKIIITHNSTDSLNVRDKVYMIDLLQGHIHEIVITANETIKARVLLSLVVVSFKAIRWEQQLRWILCNH